MNQITDELLRRQRALFLSKRRKFVNRTRLGKSSGGAGVYAARAVGQTSPINTTPINFTVTFSTPVSGFTNADVSFTGTTTGGTPAAAVTGGPQIYNVAVTGVTGSGTVAINVPAGAATDTVSGAPSPASNISTVAFDTTRPSVTVAAAAGQADPAAFPPITFTVTFSEPVTGFVATDVVITGTSGGTKAVSLNGNNAEVTGMTTAGTVIATVPVNAVTDLAGNLSTVSNSATVNWLPDIIAPTVTINKAAGQADPTSASPILFDVVFSEAVTGFVAGDIVFTGSTVGGTLAASISGTGPTYTVSVTGMAAPNGNVVASIPAASVLDLAGNANTASTSTDNIVAWTAPVGGPSGQMDFSKAANSGLWVILDDD